MSSWQRVTAASPCHKCGKNDWCSVSRDGSYAICRRVNDGRGRAKVDRGGGEYWVYALAGERRSVATWAPAPKPRASVLSSAQLNDVYASILEMLTLKPEDAADLRRRGLSDAE